MELSAEPPTRHERADAALNRHRILTAARRLLASDGVESVNHTAVARAAGVGKATVFRRYSTREELLHALLDDDTRAFQAAYVTGPPPLGPGAEPRDRLIAWGHAWLDLVLRQGNLLKEAEASQDFRHASPSHVASLIHLRVLLREAGVDADLPVLAAALFSSVDASLVLHQVRTEGVSLTRLRAIWELLVDRIVAAPR